MKIILCGGGTAGHVNPALAIAEEIKKREPGAEILFIGRTDGDENEIMKKGGFNVKTLNVKGFERRLTPKNAKSILLAMRAAGEAGKIIKEFNPDVVLGTGGYVCWPTIRAAKKAKVPTVLHESNVYPGLTTRLLSTGVDLMLLNSGKTLEYLKKRENAKVVGNPLRYDFGKIPRQAARTRLGLSERDIFILSFGGSIGAATLNDAVIYAMKEYSLKNLNVHHIHGVGRRFYNEVAKKESLLCQGKRVKIVPYVENVGELMRAADIVISRCGAMTLSELSAAGAPAILVPSPNVTDNHQLKNAKMLSEASAAILIEESNLSGAALVNELSRLALSKNERVELSRRIKNFDKPNATARIVELLYTLKAKHNSAT